MKYDAYELCTIVKAVSGSGITYADCTKTVDLHADLAKLALALKLQRSGLMFRALAEQWDAQRVMRELH